jgi:hypothetical protein
MAQDIERGAQEEASDTPVTPTEVEASKRPPSQPPTASSDRPSSSASSQQENRSE